MNKHKIIILLLLISPAISAQVGSALVIGNSKYQSLSSLPNAQNDARIIQTRLKALEYKTELLLNASEAQTRKALRAFANQTSSTNISVIFYAGHGAQVNGQNYLLPVDMEIPKRESDIELSGINVDDLIKSMRSNIKVIFLDACRNNPALIKSLPSGRGAYRSGLAAVNSGSVDKSSGIFIAYATDSDSVASDGSDGNSPFTSALAKFISEPISIDDMFSKVTREVRQGSNNTQRPYKYASIEGVVSLVPTSKRAAKEINVPGGKTNEELDFDNVIRNSNIEDIREFEARYPNSKFAEQIAQKKTEVIFSSYDSLVWSEVLFTTSEDGDVNKGNYWGYIPSSFKYSNGKLTYLLVNWKNKDLLKAIYLESSPYMTTEIEYTPETNEAAWGKERYYDSDGKLYDQFLPIQKYKSTVRKDTIQHNLTHPYLYDRVPPITRDELTILPVEVISSLGLPPDVSLEGASSDYTEWSYYPELTRTFSDGSKRVVLRRIQTMKDDKNNLLQLLRIKPEGILGFIEASEFLLRPNGDYKCLASFFFRYHNKNLQTVSVPTGQARRSFHGNINKKQEGNSSTDAYLENASIYHAYLLGIHNILYTIK